MNHRGRTSAAALSVVQMGVTTIQRPRPPAELTPEESGEWRILINALPADQYNADTYPLLVQLCRHKVNTRRIAVLKQRAIELNDVPGELAMMAAEEAQSRIISSVMTKLRITPQSRYDAKKARGTFSGKPWQDEP